MVVTCSFYSVFFYDPKIYVTFKSPHWLRVVVEKILSKCSTTWTTIKFTFLAPVFGLLRRPSAQIACGCLTAFYCLPDNNGKHVPEEIPCRFKVIVADGWEKSSSRSVHWGESVDDYLTFKFIFLSPNDCRWLIFVHKRNIPCHVNDVSCVAITPFYTAHLTLEKYVGKEELTTFGHESFQFVSFMTLDDVYIEPHLL